jgi:hypothetical protein
MSHLVVSISGHGFGHVAQTAPILNLLHERMPQLRRTVRSAVPLAYLRSRIHVPFDYLPSHGDIGGDVFGTGRSRRRPRGVSAFHANWEGASRARLRAISARTLLPTSALPAGRARRGASVPRCVRQMV